MRSFLLSILYMAALVSASSFAQSDVNFSGTLVEDPCTLAPEDSNITVDFGTVILKSLYTNKRTLPKLFALHLIECDTSLGNTVHVTFSGVEDSEQPGLLALDGTSGAKGVALGLATLHGEPLPINQVSKAFALQDGNSVIHLMAYVQASDTAITNKTLVAGDFSAIATFDLSYD
ncbi:fimbrial protein [Enterobacter asburiae]|jgi:type 1 fimbria pilin|uniref:fimbrial protein n=1 Tax=Enterobacter asburiae TaxID=61645 RepID=UPI002B77674D|nr:fimbrial protein [Enterobacter asburiae]